MLTNLKSLLGLNISSAVSNSYNVNTFFKDNGYLQPIENSFSTKSLHHEKYSIVMDELRQKFSEEQDFTRLGYLLVQNKHELPTEAACVKKSFHMVKMYIPDDFTIDSFLEEFPKISNYARKKFSVNSLDFSCPEVLSAFREARIFSAQSNGLVDLDTLTDLAYMFVRDFDVSFYFELNQLYVYSIQYGLLTTVLSEHWVALTLGSLSYLKYHKFFVTGQNFTLFLDKSINLFKSKYGIKTYITYNTFFDKSLLFFLENKHKFLLSGSFLALLTFSNFCQSGTPSINPLTLLHKDIFEAYRFQHSTGDQLEQINLAGAKVFFNAARIFSNWCNSFLKGALAPGIETAQKITQNTLGSLKK